MQDDLLHVVKWQNGPKSWSPFSNDEMERRQAKIRGHLAEHNIDACIFTSYHNICYLSGFLYCYFGRKYALVMDGDQATTVTAAIDGGQPGRRSHGDNITYTDWRKDNYFRALQELLPGAKRLGIEFDHVSLEFHQQLSDAFPDVEFVDIGQPVMWQRTIKSAEEQTLIRTGARICEVGGQACVEAVAAGVPEHEIAMASTNAMIRDIAGSFPFVELMDSWTWFQSGTNTDGAHNPVTNRVIQTGDILSLNCFPMIFGYYTALERTLFCEHASAEHLHLWQINCQVHRRGLELIRPGARCDEIAKELNEIYRAHDLLQYRSFGYGHSFGVLSHYYGREAGVELREDVETVLQAGMVVSMEPMIMIPEGQPGAGGYREHDILIVGEDDAENITTFPFGPEHNIIGS
ncbi:MAG: M24 family metallopeptidase [Rhodospirillaceae bacterium]|jgi:creatinase|nr:M24 family metallopeptidase [Rhodospirillaceae bacterium]MBT4489250.1 M24 family metallopeptidase [Rhodospirillaceae bacterium]MBT5047221.1 M24 family metallopeptidase [Rhodospirillaceae bacterium]MBT5896346.1 M24 family metallopeptidase [Rhodospirillaceae bacterium]MBT6431223.1 M24 family metallopeptidase [Rhodospirillaceae bacterium]